MERLLLCRPQGGLNDMLCQIERCRRYAAARGRRVIVDTAHRSTASFRDRFDRYFSSLDPGLSLALEAGEAAALDRLNVFPPEAAGRVSRYTVTANRETGWFEDDETGVPVQFDFRVDYGEDLLIHHASGGGSIGVDALARLALKPDLIEVLAGRLAAIGEPYTGIHIRNTDYQADYAAGLQAARRTLEGPVFIASDNRATVDEFRAALGPDRVFSFAELPRTAGARVHSLGEADDAWAANRDAIVDLMMLALAAGFMTAELKPNVFGARLSGYSVLAASLRARQQVIAQLLAPGRARLRGLGWLALPAG